MVDACGIVCLFFPWVETQVNLWLYLVPPAHTTPDDALLLRCNVKKYNAAVRGNTGIRNEYEHIR